MFGWFDENGASKVFWFKETKGGNQKLIRPDGTYRIIRRKLKHFAKMGQQALAGWQRAKLLMEEYEIWDTMAFGCTMDTLIGVQTSRYEDNIPVVYIFASCQNAERAVYPFLSEEQVATCRKNVEAFYNNVNLQAAWHDFILHPVCLKVTKGEEGFTPIAIEDIGCGQGAMGQLRFSSIGALNRREWIEELFVEYPMD